MFGELVSVVTEDKVRLDGLFSETESTSKYSIDGAVIVHGLSGNFYQSRLLKHFAQVLQAAGVSTVLINTRGHDYLNSTTKLGRATTLGAAVEVVAESKFDLFAWADFLQARGAKNVLLLGHSLGGIKSLLAQAHKPHPIVKAVAAFSATKLSFQSLANSDGGERFLQWIKEAKKLVSVGKPAELMFVDFPFPTWMSAEAYLAKYGAGEENNWMRYCESIAVPVLAAFGVREMEDNPAFRGMRHELENLTFSNFTVSFVDHADHFYSACYDAASATLLNWLSRL